MIASTVPKLIALVLILKSVLGLPDPIAGGRFYHASQHSNGDEFPFAVSLQRYPVTSNATLARRLEHFCGGTYIGRGWIVTANHCLAGVNSSSIFAYVGGSSLENTQGKLLSIVEIIRHSSYDEITLVGDIAILRVVNIQERNTEVLLPPMEDTFDFSDYFEYFFLEDYSATTGEPDEASQPEEECYIFGYGSDRYGGQGSSLLRYGQVQPIDYKDCQQLLGAVVAPPADKTSSGMFCALGIADACSGDSGGGLVCRPRPRPVFGELHQSLLGRFTLRGIISYGVGCGTPASPGVYTDIEFYRRWISDNTSL